MLEVNEVSNWIKKGVLTSCFFICALLTFQNNANATSLCHIETGRRVSPQTCEGQIVDGLCTGKISTNVTFAQAFTTPPHVKVTYEFANSNLNPACVGNGSDFYNCFAENVTTTGFKLVCNGSPAGSSCPSNGLNSFATASWVALEDENKTNCLFESDSNVVANVCDGTMTSAGCRGRYVRQINFAQAKPTAPHVIVTPHRVSDERGGSCNGFGTDKIKCHPENITRTGFLLVCNGSFLNDCGTDANAAASLASADWLAVPRTSQYQVFSAHGVETDTCVGNLVEPSLCDSSWTKTITYPTPFVRTPEVVLTMEEIGISGKPSCAGGETDLFTCTLNNNSRFGFTAVCYGSPEEGACSFNGNHPAKFGYLAVGDRAVECSDGIDNDNDGAIDFPTDTGCSGPNDPSERPECSDIIDNADADTLADAADPGCHTDGNPNNPNSYNPNDPSEEPDCSDGIDNDGDGTIDFPADAGCDNGNDPSERPQCSDGFDNADSDILADSADPGCHTDGNPNNPASYDPNDNSEGDPECSDSIDNADADTLADAADPGCHTDGNPNNPTSYNPLDPSENPDCSDGVDNDGDGTIDFPADTGCSSSDDPSERPECSDGFDNADADTLADSADPGCHTDGNPNNPGSYNPNDPSEEADCSDGIDNDGDGTIDFPADTGCRGPNDPSERPECSDGIDNADADTLADSADPGCHTDGNPNNPGSYNPNDPSEEADCSDGIDNDGDGTIDFPADAGCNGPNDPSERPECSDGIDNADADTLADSADPGCHTDGNPNNPGSYNPNDPSEEADCSDGIDNDGDGTIDFPADAGCNGPNDPSERPECSDGIDNADADTLADSADPGCHTDGNPNNPGSYNPNDPSEEADCSDGIDNDGDGTIDFPADAGCNGPNDPSERPECSDGIDNADADTLADSADPGCHTDGNPNNPGSYNPNDPSEEAGCSDGIDNDGDGTIDFPADAGCNGPNDPSERPECSDGIDNADADILADSADPGCHTDGNPNNPGSYNPNDPSEEADCSDGIDNDGDGTIDFPADAGCNGPNDPSERPECSDGFDNADVEDSLADSADPGCHTDGNASNPASYDPNDNSETDANLPAPQNVSASDGTSTQFVEVTWDAVNGATTYEVLREGPNNTGIPNENAFVKIADVNAPTTRFEDTTADPAESIFFYRVRARSGAAISGNSNTDPGFKGATRLQSPAFTKFNTFLRQWNFLELNASGTKNVSVLVTVFNLRGETMIQRTFVIPAGNQQDVDINSLVQTACNLGVNCAGFEDLLDPDQNGIVDTYGLLRLEFDDTDPQATLVARLSNYRPNSDGQTFSFGLAREIRNANRGTTYLLANTMDPQNSGFGVPNWTEIISLDRTVTFTFEMFSENGTLVDRRTRTIPPLGEFDIPSGHETLDALGNVVEAVYLVKVTPSDPTASYLASMARYSSNSKFGTVPDSYNFAFALPARAGESAAQFVATTNETGLCFGVNDWVEVANVRSDRAVTATLIFKDSAGAVVGSTPALIGPLAQMHFNASALLPKGTVGSVEIRSSDPQALIAEGLVYFNDTCGANNVQSGYAVVARTPGVRQQFGSVNTFLQMSNEISAVSTTSQVSVANAQIRLFDGNVINQAIQLNGSGANQVSLTIPADRYGALTLTSNQDGETVANVLRRRLKDNNTRVDFVIPTKIQ